MSGPKEKPEPHVYLRDRMEKYDGVLNFILSLGYVQHACALIILAIQRIRIANPGSPKNA